MNLFTIVVHVFILSAPTPQNGQAHSNNPLATVDELFVCLTILWGWCLKG